jgi:membrane peptidoglycan carboxypeptidase
VILRVARLLGALIMIAVVSGAAVLATFLTHWYLSLPDYRQLDQLQLEGTTRVYARDGALIGVLAPTIGGERFDRRPAKLTEISPLLVASVIAAEDRDFFKHYGFEPQAVVRSVLETFVRDNRQGGSTITQQLMRLTILPKDLLNSPKRLIERKIKEIMLSVQVERYFTKEEILTAFLNTTFWGGNLKGIRASAQAYFGKDPLELTLAESIYLTALLPAPNVFFQSYKRAREGMRLRLDRLVEDGWVTPEQGKAAWLEKVQPKGWQITYDGQGNIKDAKLLDPKVNRVEELRTEFATHFMFEIRKILKSRFPDNQIFSGGGLKVFTTLDTKAQQSAETAVTRARVPWQANIAVVGLDPYTGEVLAMVGGNDLSGKDEFNRVASSQMRRSPGSSVKPLLYATAIEQGINQWDSYMDAPIRLRIPGTDCFGARGVWCPKNFDGPSANLNKPVSLRYALDHSLNLPTINLGIDDRVGRERFRDKLRLLGITVPDELPYSSFIGGIDVNPLQMASAYASFVNGGLWIQPRYISRVEDASGRVLYDVGNDATLLKRRVWSPQTAWVALDMIRGVVNDPASISGQFALDARIPGVNVGGKTGTSNGPVDMWFVGTTPRMTAAVWIGRDDNKPMYGRNVYSGRYNPPVWRDFVRRALEGKPPGDFREPANIGYRTVQGVRMAYNTRPGPINTNLSSPIEDIVEAPRRRPAVDGPTMSANARVTVALDMCQRNPANVNPLADASTPPRCVQLQSVLVTDLRYYDPNFTLPPPPPPVIRYVDPPPAPPAVEPAPPPTDIPNTFAPPPPGSP